MELVEVSIPDLDGLLGGSSTISYDLKWDLNDFLAERPDAPVHTLHEILEGGLYAQAMEAQFRARDTVSARDSEARRAVTAKQARVREVLEIVFAANDLDAIAYPTVRRKAALIGEGQQGSSCQLSAGSGFPAITMPAGFTRDELPIGLELLGRPHTDERLVGWAYAYERAFHPRRPPRRTPALIRGERPAPASFTVAVEGPGGLAAQVRFTWTAATGRFVHSVRLSGAREDVQAVTLDLKREDGSKGPVVLRLWGPGQGESAYETELTAADREALVEGRLLLSLYARGLPRGVVSVPVALPGT